MRQRNNVMLTGSNGLLGTNTIIELLSQGYFVKGVVRKKESYKGPSHKNLELIEADITNLFQLKNVVKNCDYIIHCAAMTDQNMLNYESYYNVNVSGFKNIVELASIHNVKRLIYVSTANEFGYGSRYDLGNETKPIKYPFNKSFYALSKKEAHDFIKTEYTDLEIIVVNPTFMIGPYDFKPSSGKIIRMGLKQRIVLCPPGGKNFVCVSDVALGITKALEHGANREAYILAGQNLSFYEFFKLLRKKAKRHFIIVKIPKQIMTIIGVIGNILRCLKIKTDLSIVNMASLCIKNYYSNRKAKTKLSMEFNPIENGIEESVKWFKQKDF